MFKHGALSREKRPPRRTLCIALALLLASAGRPDSSHAQIPLMAPAPSVEVGPGSGEIVLVDVDRDGHLDLVTKHLLEHKVVVLRGDGTGRLTAPADGPMNFDFRPGAMLLGDVNDDGVVDMIVARRDDDHEFVHVYLGDGEGQFRQEAGPPVTVSPSAETYKPILVLADVNDDGKMDVIFANGRRNTVEVLLGNGKGAFSVGSRVKLEAGMNRYYSAVADVNGDGHVDLATSGSAEDGGPGRLWVHVGDGTGTFSEASHFSTTLPPGPRLATIADVNDDALLDIVLSHVGTGVSVLMNDGDGRFKPAAGSPYDVGGEAFAVVVAHLNGDLLPDLAAATVNSVAVLLGGSGRAFVPAPGSPFAAGPGAYNLHVGDVNEDGKADLAASSFEGNAVTLLLGQ